MAYLTAAAEESRDSRTFAAPAAPPTSPSRLRAGILLVGLLSLAAAFWAAVISLVA
jgi:hypothetical protein